MLNILIIARFGNKYDQHLSCVEVIEPYLGVMVGVCTSSVVDCGFSFWSGKTKYYQIGICFLSTKDTPLRCKSKDWLAWSQDNVSEWSNMSTHRLFQ